VNPDVDPKTHPYISTGLKETKFGVAFAAARPLYARAAALPNIAVRGIDIHIGSQIGDVAPLREAAVKVRELVEQLGADGITLHHIDLGGGLGIQYNDETPLEPEALAEAVRPVIAPLGLALHLEPGRFLVGSAGILLATVLYRKHAGGKDFVIVDAGMTDFVRPSHYNAHHEIVPLKDGKRGEEVVSVVGPICEDGDFLALDRKMPVVMPGAALAVLGTGAYGFVMSSTYNQRPRPPEVLVEGDRYFVSRPRETLDDLLRGETAEPTTWYKA